MVRERGQWQVALLQMNKLLILQGEKKNIKTIAISLDNGFKTTNYPSSRGAANIHDRDRHTKLGQVTFGTRSVPFKLESHQLIQD